MNEERIWDAFDPKKSQMKINPYMNIHWIWNVLCLVLTDYGLNSAPIDSSLWPNRLESISIYCAINRSLSIRPIERVRRERPTLWCCCVANLVNASMPTQSLRQTIFPVRCISLTNVPISSIFPFPRESLWAAFCPISAIGRRSWDERHSESCHPMRTESTKLH